MAWILLQVFLIKTAIPYKTPDIDKRNFNFAKKLAMDGNPSAQYRLACFYEKGKGARKDYSKALQWYKKAAANGNKAAIIMLKKLKEEK